MKYGRSVPGEWTNHELTTVVMPWREVVWGQFIDNAWCEYVCLVNKVADSEPVLVICRPEQYSQALRDLSRSNIRIVPFEYDDGWVRDNGPITVVTRKGGRRAVGFDFNSWGRRFLPFDGDRQIGRFVADNVRIQYEGIPFVLEGGAVSFNGLGTALVVEECVLNSNRNGSSVTKSKFSDVLRRALGVEQVVWLPFGLLEDLPNTDGHVDNVAVFCGSGKVLAQTVPAKDPNHGRLQENLSVLCSTELSAVGRVTVVECTELPRVNLPGCANQPAPYINYVTTNSSVIFPTVGASSDGYATDLFRGLYPGRTVRSSPSRFMTYGGGGLHCVSMQIAAEPQ